MKKYKPTTPSRRNMSGIEYRKFLSKKAKPLKKLVIKLKKKGGRNNQGRITTRHRGGGHKRRYRLVDFKREEKAKGKIESVEYDASRTAFIARVLYQNGKRSYILAPQDLKVGDEVLSSNEKAPIKPGNRLPLKNIPLSTFVYNIELNPGEGGKIARSAGSSAQVAAKEGGFVNLVLPSGEVRKVLEKSLASVGVLSNSENRMVRVGKAGRSRWKGKRPTVRGSAMNPVDHPFGGGEGRAPAGMKRPKNKWGKGIRGVKTRKNKKASDKFIIKKRKKRKRKK